MNGTPDVHDLRGGPARPHALRSLLAAAAFGAVALAAVWASAADLFWDTNGPTPGSGPATGTWGPDAFWNTDSTGGSDGTFTTDTTADENLLIAAGTNGTGGTITVSSVQSANSVTFRNDVAVTISGGTRINLGSATLGGAGIFVTSDSRQSNAIATPITLGTNVTFQTLGGGLSLPSVSGFGDVAIVNSGVGSSVGMNGFGGTVFNNIGSVSYSGTSYARSTIGGPIGVNVTALRQGSDTSNLTLADVISVNPTGLTIGNSGIQSLTFFRDNTDLNVLSGTGAVTFDNDSPYAIPMGIDINGNKGQMTVSNTGALTNSGSGRGGVRLDAQITSNVTSITQASPTSTLYLMQYVNVPGAGPAVQNVNTFAGPVNLDAGILFMGASYSSSGGNQPVITALGVTKALENSGPITFSGGTLMYANPSSTDLSQKFTNTSTAPYSLDTNGQSVSLGSALLANDTKGLRKLGPGTLTLTAANTYTGTTTIGGGTVLLDCSDASVPASDMLNPANRLTLGGDGTIPVIAGGGTLLIKAKPSGVTSQNLSIPLPALSNPGVVTNTGSHRILVDPNGGAGTNVLMGKLANVIGNADSGNAQRLTSNGSTLLLGKTAGAGAGDVRFLFATDGRNGTGYGGTLGGRVVYTPDGGGDLDFCVTFDNTSTPYSIIPVGTGGYAYTPLTDGGGGGASSSGIVFGGGTLQYSAANTFDYSDRFLGSSQSAVGQPYRIDTNGQSVAFQYPLTSASGTLTKLGEGTLTLARFSNTYTGNTTIAGGTLALGASATMALTPSIQITSPTATFDVSARTAAAGLTLASNQELKGVGSVKGTITLGTGSVLSPGMNVGSLSFQNNLTLSATSVLRFDLGSSLTAGATYDQVVVAGVLALGAGTLNFSNFDFLPLGGFADGTYTLFRAGSLSGSLGSSLTGKVGSGDATVSTSGTELVLTGANYVPEPSSLVLLAAAAPIPADAWRSRSRLLGPVIVVPLREVSS